MANTNFAATFSSDIENYIQEKTLPLVQRQLVAYQFGDPLRLPKNRGSTYTASRYDRVPLPFAPLSEGVPPVGESLSLVQVSATAQQWGDSITVTDVADMTIKHPLFQKAIDLVAMQIGETLERNTFNYLLNSGTQINYVNSRGARASLLATDVLNPHEINRAAGILYTLGAPQYNGQLEEDQKIAAGKPTMASKDPRGMSHYVAIVHPLVEQDMRENATVVTAWAYSDVNRLYNNELGEWGGVRFTRSNMVPGFYGLAAPTTGASTTSGSYATNTTGGTLATGNYYLKITGSVTQNGYETLITATSGAIAVTGPTGSITVTLPTVTTAFPSATGYLWNIYLGTSTTAMYLAATTSGPTSGPYAGYAATINQAVYPTPVLTAVATASSITSRPLPVAPAAGITVFPTLIFGKNAYGQVMLDDPKFFYLSNADKSDPANQLRVVAWKVMYGTISLNQNFFMRIESSTNFSTSFG